MRDRWAYEWVDRRTNTPTDGKIDSQVERQTDIRKDRQTKRHTQTK